MKEVQEKSIIKDTPDISVIIPVNNVEKYLKRCLDSILTNTYKNIEDIRKLKENVSNLSHQDYFELASFCDEDEEYSCDLIILNGKLGFRYNKHNEDDLGNLIFQEHDVNLDNEVSLMLDMQKRLEKFINDELEYSITMDTNIKI